MPSTTPRTPSRAPRILLSLLIGAALTTTIAVALVFLRLTGPGLNSTPHAATLATSLQAPRKIAIIVSPAGSAPLETLAPLSLLPQALQNMGAPAPAVELVLYHSSPAAARVGGDLLLRPHRILSEINPADYAAVILPPFAASEDLALWSKFQALVARAPITLAFGESARFLALSVSGDPAKANKDQKLPLRSSVRFAAPYASSKEVAKAFPEVDWVLGRRVVTTQHRERTLITSPGSGATHDAVFALARALAKQPEYAGDPAAPAAIPRLTPSDFASWLRWIGLLPRMTRATIALTPGLEEAALAYLIDTLGKSGAVSLQSSTLGSEWVHTAHGFEVASTSPGSLSGDALLLLPGGNTTPLQLPVIQRAITEQRLIPKSFFHVPLESVQSEALDFLHRILGAGSETFIARFAERQLVPAPPLSEAPPHWGGLAFALILWGALSGLGFGMLKLAERALQKVSRQS